jgi:hypothetical protein
MQFTARLLFVSYVTFASLVVTNAQSTTKQNERGYFGPVLSVRSDTVEYGRDQGKLRHGRRKPDSFERFDKDGRLLEEKHFKDDGSILWDNKYVYDARGRLIESSGTHSKFVYLPERRVYRYDSKANLIEESGFDSQGRLVNKNEYAYDEKGRKRRWTSMSYHPEENSRPHQWTYDYYENGLVKEERAFSDEGGGFLPTDSLGGPHRKLFMYNPQNKPAFALLFNANGAFAGLESTVYDRRGNELEEVQYDSGGSPKGKTKYSYRFDQFGNPTVQNTYEWNGESSRGSYYLKEVSYQIIRYGR